MRVSFFVLFSSQRMMSNKSEKGNSEASIMDKKEERTEERTVATTTVATSHKENGQQESACMGMGSDVKNSVEKNLDNNAVSNTENTTVNNVENNGENNAENNAENNPESHELPELVASTAGRIPFTSLSQVDADMALARALQEQVCRYKMNVQRLSCSSLSVIWYVAENQCKPLGVFAVFAKF